MPGRRYWMLLASRSQDFTALANWVLCGESFIKVEGILRNVWFLAGLRVKTPPVKYLGCNIKTHFLYRYSRIKGIARALISIRCLKVVLEPMLSFMEEGLEKALRYYQQALSLDPNYAPVHSAIAEWYWVLPIVGGQKVSREYVYTKAMEAINKALEIDNNLPEAHATLGLLKMVYEWDWEGAEKAFKTGLNLNPGSSKSHYDYSIYLSIVKNSPKSIDEARKAVELDPLSGNAHFTLGLSLYTLGQLDQALEELQYAREMIPRNLPSTRVLVITYIEKGMLDEAIEEIKRGLGLFPKDTQLIELMGRVSALKGEKENVRAILDELVERSKKEYVSSLVIAQLYAFIGEIDKAFEYLEKGYERRELEYGTIRLSPLSRILRGDPRFIALLKKMGLEP